MYIKRFDRFLNESRTNNSVSLIIAELGNIEENLVKERSNIEEDAINYIGKAHEALYQFANYSEIQVKFLSIDRSLKNIQTHLSKLEQIADEDEQNYIGVCSEEIYQLEICLADYLKNPHPEVFIDSDKKQLVNGRQYEWMDEKNLLCSFDKEKIGSDVVELGDFQHHVNDFKKEVKINKYPNIEK